MMNHNLHDDKFIWCENCGVEITCGGFGAHGHIYCCRLCYQGLACDCGERMEMEEERRGGQSVEAPLSG